MEISMNTIPCAYVSPGNQSAPLYDREVKHTAKSTKEKDTSGNPNPEKPEPHVSQLPADYKGYS